MTQLRDPYVVLGLPRGASLDEVKRAYRRLAKQHHPDSGGQRTLARWLEIQAAYEQLVHGRAGGPGTAGGAPRSPWQADPARADATRRAYGRGRRSGPRPGSPPPSGAGGSTREEPKQEPRQEPRRRGPRKATLGSTSYDEAADQPFDPDWTGASWYGTTSGTYWTLNPREYADPRKHGPEYQARARRLAGVDAEPGDPDAEAPAEQPAATVDAAEAGAGAAPAPEAAPAAEAATAPETDPQPEATGWRPAAETSTGTEWSATPGTARGPRAPSSAAQSPGERRRSSPEVAPPSGAATGPPRMADVSRLLDPRASRTPAARLLLALAGGVPIAIWLAWLLGELTGCGRFAATCQPEVVTTAWVAGFLLVIALVLLPAAAAILVTGTVGALIAAIPATVFLTATGGARMPEESGIVLGFGLIVGWLAGVMLATNEWWRGSGRPGPVS